MDEFSTIIQQIKEYGIDINRLNENRVKRIIVEYENFKNKNGYYDREDIHRLAYDRFKENFGHLFVFGIKSLPVIHKKLFERLISYCETFNVFLPFILESGIYESHEHFQEVKEFWERMCGDVRSETDLGGNLLVAREVLKIGSADVDNHTIEIRNFTSREDELEVVYIPVALRKIVRNLVFVKHLLNAM